MKHPILTCVSPNDINGADEAVKELIDSIDDEEERNALSKTIGMRSMCFWFTNFTQIPGEKTLDPSMRSFPQLEKFGDPEYDKFPWLAPGSAPVYSPCGAYMGNPYGCRKAPIETLQDIGHGDIEDECDPVNRADGPLAEDYYMSPGCGGCLDIGCQP